MNDMQAQVLQWMASGETGLSSLTMALWLGCGQKYRDSSHPYDPDDLRRCVQFLDAAPACRPFLGRMAELGPEWAALIGRWDDLERLLLKELPAGRAPKTFVLMRELLERTP